MYAQAKCFFNRLWMEGLRGFLWVCAFYHAREVGMSLWG